MSLQIAGFYFSANADKSANDHALYVDDSGYGGPKGCVTLGARYKNSERNHLYEIELDADDLERFGLMCVEHAKLLRRFEGENDGGTPK